MMRRTSVSKLQPVQPAKVWQRPAPSAPQTPKRKRPVDENEKAK